MLSYKYHEWSTGTFDTIKTSSYFLLKKAKFSLVTGLNCTEIGKRGSFQQKMTCDITVKSIVWSTNVCVLESSTLSTALHGFYPDHKK